MRSRVRRGIELLVMKRQRMIGWMLGGGVGLSLAVGFVWSRRPSRPALPAVGHYGALPLRFNQALQDVRDQSRAQPNDPELVRKLAHLYHANRLYPEAKTCYAVIESKPPGLVARDHYYLADIAQNEGDLDRALTELRAVAELEPHYLPARVGAAEALFKSGREDEAKKEYTAIAALSPNQAQAALGLARLALQRGDDGAAISWLEKLLAAHPESTSGAALLAQILSRRGEAERADALTQWSRQKHEPVPDDPWMTDLLADCYDGQRLALKFEEYFFAGQIEEAVRFLNRVEELDPKSWLPQLLRGWSQARAHHDAEAVAEYRAALSKGGDAEKILPLLVTSLLQLDRAQEAATISADYSAMKPDSQPILIAYADAVARQGDGAKTRALLTKLLEKEPYLYAQNLSLAKILWTAGERDEAAKCLRRIVQTFPNDVASRGLLGQYYLEKSEPLAAISPLEQALEQTAAPTPAHERLKTMLTTSYFQSAAAEAGSARFAEAVLYYDKVVLLAPRELAPYLGKANALVQLKQFGHAAVVLEKMAVLQPENPTILISLGDVLYQGGDEGEARRRWQQALPLAAPGDLELRKALDHRLNDHLSAEDFK